MLLAAVQSSEARRWGVGVSWLLLAPTTPSAIGVRTGVPNGNAMRVGLHKVCAAGARRQHWQVQCHARALERLTMGNPRFLFTLGPPRNGSEASLLSPIGTLQHHSTLKTFASDLPRASHF